MFSLVIAIMLATMVAHGQQFVTGNSTSLGSSSRYALEITELSQDILRAPNGRNVSSKIAEILEAIRILPVQDVLLPLENVGKVLELNPVRPRWHVLAAKAFSLYSLKRRFPDIALIYIHLLEQIIDEVTPYQFYHRYDFADQEIAQLLFEIGLEPPIVSGYDLPFLRASGNIHSVGPIQAQLLQEIARTYKDHGHEVEASLYYDRYLQLYWPYWQSVEIAFREHPQAPTYIDPFFVDQPTLPSLSHIYGQTTFPSRGI